MKRLRLLTLGLLSSIASSLVMVGVLMVALSEGLVIAPQVEQPTEIVPVIEPSLEPGQPTSVPATSRPTRTAMPVFLTATPKGQGCTQRPTSWQAYAIGFNDTADSLAARLGITVKELLDKNCLVSVSALAPSSIIYLPPFPTATVIQVTLTLTLTQIFTPSAAKCGPPRDWTTYRVRSGDTLFHLSQLYGVSVSALQFANCLGYQDQIIAGQILYVPDVVLPTPTYTFTLRPSSTLLPPTRTRTPTLVSTITATLTLPPSHTPTLATPTPTSTPTPTKPPVPTGTSTATPTGTNTFTPTKTDTPVPSATPTPTTSLTTAPTLPLVPGG